MTIPEMEHNELQAENRRWWDTNPMTYDWQQTMQVETGSPEFFAEVDRRFFEAHANFGHPGYPAEPAFNQQLQYETRQGQRVLEIGCGMGGTAATMADQGVDITAIDLSTNAVMLTRERLNQRGLNAVISLADGEKLPFADQTFDLVWSWGVIHHSAHTEQIISEIYRVLKPGGEVKIMVYHRHALRNWISAGLNRGILRGEFLSRSYDEILRDVTDGFIARHITRDEATAWFSAFENIEIELTDYADLSFVPGNVQVERYLVGRIIPRSLKQRWDNWLISNFGWFLYLEARRPA